MARRREQHVAEIPEDVRPDCFPLIAARECGQHALVDGNGEMIRPELGEPLDEGPIGRDRLAKARTGLGEIDRTDELRKLLERADPPVRPRTRASPVIAAAALARSARMARRKSSSCVRM